jgi:thiol:disulfide interchange protein
MLFALSLMIPLLVLAVWVFWRLSPKAAAPATVRAFNVGAIALGLLFAVAVAFYVRASMAEATDRNLWPAIAAYYVMAAVPLWLAVAGGIRRLLFGAREPAKPLEISQDLSKTRF